MRLWGKFFGFVIGFMFGRIFGALLGLWLGHLYDKRAASGVGFRQILGQAKNRQAIFFNTTFAVMGHVAKASGHVTETDIRIATLLMDQMRLTGKPVKRRNRHFVRVNRRILICAAAYKLSVLLRWDAKS